MVKRFLRAVVNVFICVTAFDSSPLTAQPLEWPQLPKELRSKKFPQRLVADCSLPLPPARPEGASRVLHERGMSIEIAPADTEVRIRPISQSVGDWTVRIAILPVGCRIWQADLDRNGQMDLIISSWTEGNGPGVEVTLILIDNRQRPVPWNFGFGYFDVGENGLDNLVDLDGNGKSELLYLHAEGRQEDNEVRSITRYAIETAGLRRINGRAGGFRFPVTSPSGRKPLYEPDLSSVIDVSLKASTIDMIHSSDTPCDTVTASPERVPVNRVRVSENFGCFYMIVLSDGRRLQEPEMVVLDFADRRNIAWNNSVPINSLLREAFDKKLKVRLRCMFDTPLCKPFIVWASE
jgi:hypothetical protein